MSTYLKTYKAFSAVDAKHLFLLNRDHRASQALLDSRGSQEHRRVQTHTSDTQPYRFY